MTTGDHDRERTIEFLMHNIAACLHFGMNERGVTKSELKELLVDWRDKTILDDMLSATVGDRINSSHLADVAFVLGFKWDFKIKPIPNPQPALAAETDAR